MANLTASIIIKPTAALNRGDTSVFSSWVCIANSAGSFQRHLTTTLISPKGEQLKCVPQIFCKVSNNEAEYGTLLHGLPLTISLGIKRLLVSV
jgi:hypothetical protein